MTRLSLARSLHPPPPPVSHRASVRPPAIPRLPALPSRVCPAAAAQKGQKEGGGGGLGFDGRGKEMEGGKEDFYVSSSSSLVRFCRRRAKERGALGLWSMAAAVHFRWHADVERRQ